MGEMDGKVALVTGAGSGIGRCSAQAFAARGAAVLVCDVTDGRDETVNLITKTGGAAVAATMDVTDEESVAAGIQLAVDGFGRLDYAHNNAGVAGTAALLHEWSTDIFEKVLRVNLIGVFTCMKYELAQMLEQGGGSIVNTASTSGLGGTPLMPGYVASKHGVVGLTKGTAVDYAKKNIRINAVCPGSVKTPMIMDWIAGDEDMLKLHNEAQPIGRMALPEEVAEAVVWLASDHAAFVTGVALPVDGAMMAAAGGGK